MTLQWEITLPFLPKPSVLAPPLHRWSGGSHVLSHSAVVCLNAASMIRQALYLKHTEALRHPSYVWLSCVSCRYLPTLQIQYVSTESAASHWQTSQHRADIINSESIQLLKWLHVVRCKSKMPKGAFVWSNIHSQQYGSSYIKKTRACVGECAAGRKTQTFPFCAVGDLQGVDALGDLLVGGFLGDHWAFELTLRSVQGF